MQRRNTPSKKAMSQFEIIGYAIMAIVVIIVAILVFSNLSKGPSTTIGKFTENTDANTDSCIKNPAGCQPFGSTATTSPYVGTTTIYVALAQDRAA